MVQLSTEMVESDNSEVILSDIPENKLVQPLSWNSMKSFLEGGMDGMHTEYAEARIGEGMLVGSVVNVFDGCCSDIL